MCSKMVRNSIKVRFIFKFDTIDLYLLPAEEYYFSRVIELSKYNKKNRGSFKVDLNSFRLITDFNLAFQETQCSSILVFTS